MPSVERAESANEADTAVVGSSAIMPRTHPPSAAKLADRLPAISESCSVSAMTNARTADTGIPASTR